MKMHLRAVLTLVAATCLGACASGVGPDFDLSGGPFELTLAYGEDTQVGESDVHVTFDRVIEDSRCAIDVVCVWEGNATVELGIRVGMGDPASLRLNTALDPIEAVWNGIRVRIVSLVPAPRSTEPTRLEDYRVTVRVSPVT